MAGSLNHIIDDDGTFTMNLIENMGDAHEALEECHQIIGILLTQLPGINPKQALINVCSNLGYPIPAQLPVIQPDLHGCDSVFREAANA